MNKLKRQGRKEILQWEAAHTHSFTILLLTKMRRGECVEKREGGQTNKNVWTTGYQQNLIRTQDNTLILNTHRNTASGRPANKTHSIINKSSLSQSALYLHTIWKQRQQQSFSKNSHSTTLVWSPFSRVFLVPFFLVPVQEVLKYPSFLIYTKSL